MRRVFFLFVFCISFGFAANSYTLSLRDVRPTMDKMFTYHVENKEFNQMIVKRSMKIYIEQFDPTRISLLKGEVAPFLAMPSEQTQKVVNQYHQGEFLQYWNLNFMIEQAILRNRRIRHEQIERLINEGTDSLSRTVPRTYTDYPATEEELKNRIYDRLILEVQTYTKQRKVKEVSPQLVQKILHHRVKRRAAFEAHYLGGSEHELALHMLKALAKSLDAHTGYYSPLEAHEIRAALKKEFSGVGVVLREDFDGVYVSDLIHGGPADKSGGIQVGDILVAINRQGVEDLTFEQLLEVMKGKAGSKITLGVKRDEEVVHVDLIRQKITMDDERLSLASTPCGDGIIGKITVPAFYDNGGQVSLDRDMREALRVLKSEGKLQGLVLDFRENSGGFLSQAVKVSSLFMNGGLIVISKYSDGEVSYQRNIDGRQYYEGPLVILTSKASASAAEIVAQALQDYGVALIVGDERSYGKGSMQYQTITNERARAFFKVTVGRYYTASGRSPQIQGVQADIVVPTAFFPYNIGERYLEFPLSNDHLSNDTFHSLMNIKQGSYHDVARFTVPYLKPRESKWRQMLPQLTANSRERLANDQNFQFFLKVGKGYQPKRAQTRREASSENYGMDDLQVKESVSIVKDMISIQQQNSLQ